ncbi:MHS family alpha-ketoglutarate permease-like MFS transporter [Arthrobacter bambusae]|uniref:MHS family alpha-ketoglutarate permease-like MFS transporter n=1 Tax=Arthrobacter bambusae TaxID=1338426 RepID=A0ABV2P184_9MICC
MEVPTQASLDSSKSAQPSSSARPISKRRTIIGTGIGNAVEWYDWMIYATFAPFFASQLFNNQDPASAVLSTLAIFAVGFLARPLGGFLFGWLGDRVGRKYSMTVAVGMSSLGSLLVGIAPTYAAVGAFASVMLLVARLIQGLAHGGELPSSQTYLAEMAPREHRGFWSTLIYVSGTLGNLAGTMLGVVLVMVLSKDDMLSWGWRVPFLIGAALGLYALVMRARLKETDVFEHVTTTQKREPMWPQIVRHRRQALQVIGLTVGGTVLYYTWGVLAPTYASTSLGMDRGAALWAGAAANVVFLAALLLWGKISDKIGRKPLMWICMGGGAVMHFPMTWLLQDSPWQLFVSMSVMLVFIAAASSILPAVFAEMFPTSIRTVGVGVPYSIAVAIFGGTAPYLNSWLTGSFGPIAFGFYVVVLLLISMAVIFTIPETKGKDLR